MSESGKAVADRCVEDLEREKYQKVWKLDSYAKTSPAFHRYFDDVKAAVGESQNIIEFGCGAGYALKHLANLGKNVLGVDIAKNCLRVDVPFMEACLWHEMDCRADVGFCVDVLEHLPTDKVQQTINQIMKCVPRCLFIACMLPDNGKHTGGDPLHLTVKPAHWWKEMAEKCGNVESFRSDARSSIFVLNRNAAC